MNCLTLSGFLLNTKECLWHDRHALLTHWGWVKHICINNLTIIGWDNGLSPGRCQDIICTNAGVLLIWTLGPNFSEIISKIHAFPSKKMHLKMLSAKWQPFCLSHNVLGGIPSIQQWDNRTWPLSHSFNKSNSCQPYWLLLTLIWSILVPIYLMPQIFVSK